MGIIKSNSLHHYAWIMGSDDDQPIVEEIYAGFDDGDNLIISIDHIDYEDHRYDCSTWVFVDRHETKRLARRLKVKLYDLPVFIGKSMDDWAQIVNANFTQVKACFKEITECLLDEGCRFCISRTYGPHGHLCC